jgi:hypothetical protein
MLALDVLVEAEQLMSLTGAGVVLLVVEFDMYSTEAEATYRIAQFLLH